MPCVGWPEDLCLNLAVTVPCTLKKRGFGQAGAVTGTANEQDGPAAWDLAAIQWPCSLASERCVCVPDINRLEASIMSADRVLFYKLTHKPRTIV
jgi:hypothetical protein